MADYSRIVANVVSGVTVRVNVTQGQTIVGNVTSGGSGGGGGGGGEATPLSNDPTLGGERTDYAASEYASKAYTDAQQLLDEKTANKDQASGYAGLDDTLKNLPGSMPGFGSSYLQGPQARSLRVGWANKASQPVNVLIVGDSVTAGYSASTYSNSWVAVMTDRLQQAFGQPQNVADGYYMIDWAGHANTSYTGKLWTYTGSPTYNLDLGLGLSNITLHSGDTVTSPSVVCDRLWVTYPRIAGLGAFDVYIDGSLAATVSGAGTPTLGTRIWDSGVLTRTSHTVTIQPHGASNTRVEGVMFFDGNGGSSGTNGTGMRVWNAGHFGYSTTQFAASGASSWWTDGLDNVNPQLVVISLGINDQRGGLVTASQYETNLNTIIARINTVSAANGKNPPSYLIVSQYGTGTSAGASTDYQKAARSAAKTNNAMCVDFYELLGWVGTSTADIYSLMSSLDPSTGKVHPNDTGHKIIGNAMAAYILTSAGSDGSTNAASINTQQLAKPVMGNIALYPISGQYSTVAGNTTTGALTANIERAIPVTFAYVPNNAAKIGAWVQTTVASANVRLGLRADAGLSYPYPGNLIADFGTIDAHTATGWQEISINQALAPGVQYWLTATAQGGNANMVNINATGYTLAGASSVLSGSMASYGQSGVSGALPATFSATPAIQALCPRIAIGF